jgi:hypothetical protein
MAETKLESAAGQGVLVMMRTPLTSEAATGVLPETLTVRQAFDALKTTVTSEGGRRVLAQLEKEVRTQHDWLVVTANGNVTKTDAEAHLGDLAERREVRTPIGVTSIKVVGIEAQSYARVG